MILAALSLAGAMTVATPSIDVAPPLMAERTPNLYRPPGPECGDIERRVRNDQREQLRKLGRLPDGVLQYAVLRTVGGCAVPTPVGYHPPMLPGAADNPPTAPVTREGEPSNRR